MYIVENGIRHDLTEDEVDFLVEHGIASPSPTVVEELRLLDPLAVDEDEQTPLPPGYVNLAKALARRWEDMRGIALPDPRDAREADYRGSATVSNASVMIALPLTPESVADVLGDLEEEGAPTSSARRPPAEEEDDALAGAIASLWEGMRSVGVPSPWNPRSATMQGRALFLGNLLVVVLPQPSRREADEALAAYERRRHEPSAGIPLTPDLRTFLTWEVDNERAGGVSPATLESALDSYAQWPNEAEGHIQNWSRLGEDLRVLLAEHGPAYEVRNLLSTTPPPAILDRCSTACSCPRSAAGPSEETGLTGHAPSGAARYLVCRDVLDGDAYGLLVVTESTARRLLKDIALVKLLRRLQPSVSSVRHQDALLQWVEANPFRGDPDEDAYRERMGDMAWVILDEKPAWWDEVAAQALQGDDLNGHLRVADESGHVLWTAYLRVNRYGRAVTPELCADELRGMLQSLQAGPRWLRVVRWLWRPRPRSRATASPPGVEGAAP